MQEQLKKNLEELGIEGEGLRLFSVVLIPLLSEFIEQMLLNAFTDEEVFSIEQEAAKQGVNEDQMMDLYMKFYEHKTGKTIQEESWIIINGIVESVKETMGTFKKIAQKVESKDMTDEQKEEEMENYTKNLIDRELRKISSINKT